MTTDLEYMKRLSKQQERLKSQAERIRNQNKMEKERAFGAKKRGESITGMDELEREKISRQLRWSGKWDWREARWNARSRK